MNALGCRETQALPWALWKAPPRPPPVLSWPSAPFLVSLYDLYPIYPTCLLYWTRCSLLSSSNLNPGGVSGWWFAPSPPPFSDQQRQHVCASFVKTEILRLLLAACATGGGFLFIHAVWEHACLRKSSPTSLQNSTASTLLIFSVHFQAVPIDATHLLYEQLERLTSSCMLILLSCWRIALYPISTCNSGWVIDRIQNIFMIQQCIFISSLKA